MVLKMIVQTEDCIKTCCYWDIATVAFICRCGSVSVINIRPIFTAPRTSGIGGDQLLVSLMLHCANPMSVFPVFFHCLLLLVFDGSDETEPKKK